MTARQTFRKVLLLLAAASLLAACRKEEPIVPSTSTPVAPPGDSSGGDGSEERIRGFFLLNEGNMGSNKATLDYFDYATGVYTKNIYAERNPGVVKELGDVGNDLQVYGGKLYAVINCSHFVEVMDLRTARHITQISFSSKRYPISRRKGNGYTLLVSSSSSRTNQASFCDTLARTKSLSRAKPCCPIGYSVSPILYF